MHPVFRHIPNVHCIITMCLSVRVFPSETTGCILCVGLQYTTRWYLKIMSPCHKDVTNTGTISTHTIATWRCSLKSVLLGNSYMPTKRCPWLGERAFVYLHSNWLCVSTNNKCRGTYLSIEPTDSLRRTYRCRCRIYGYLWAPLTFS